MFKHRSTIHLVLPLLVAGVSLTALFGCASKKIPPAVSTAAAAPSARAAKEILPATAEQERYQSFSDNPVHVVAREPVATFSIDVDTGSFSNVRRFLKLGQRPPLDAVRTEELINYFTFDPALPADGHPFALTTDLAPSPWSPDKQLLRIKIDAIEPGAAPEPPANLVFLVDVSGSMATADKLPLVKSSLRMLVNRLRPQDRVALVVYAGRTCVELPSTPGDQKALILRAINRLTAEGSTAGEAALKLAYDEAERGFIKGGINRVLMATDGDFNVGLADVNALEDMVGRMRHTGISLTTLGFGTGNFNDHLMERLADTGNGNYAYIDSVDEARKVLVTEMGATLNTVAADVKMQIEFNPARVLEYRQIGYENRQLNEQDFSNDQVDAGDIGAGKTVTALYELTPVGTTPAIAPRRYEANNAAAEPPTNRLVDEIGFLRIRYKPVNATTSLELTSAIRREHQYPDLASAPHDLRFAAAVAGFGQLLRDGPWLGSWSYAEAAALAKDSLGEDPEGYRRQFLGLIETARDLGFGSPMAGTVQGE